MIFLHKNATIKSDLTREGYVYPLINVVQFNLGYELNLNDLSTFFEHQGVDVDRPSMMTLKRGYLPEPLFKEFLRAMDVPSVEELQDSHAKAKALVKVVETQLKGVSLTPKSHKLMKRLAFLYAKALTEGKSWDYLNYIRHRIEEKIEDRHEKFIPILETCWMQPVGWYSNPHQVVQMALCKM